MATSPKRTSAARIALREQCHIIAKPHSKGAQRSCVTLMLSRREHELLDFQIKRALIRSFFYGRANRLCNSEMDFILKLLSEQDLKKFIADIVTDPTSYPGLAEQIIKIGRSDYRASALLSKLLERDDHKAANPYLRKFSYRRRRLVVNRKSRLSSRR